MSLDDFVDDTEKESPNSVKMGYVDLSKAEVYRRMPHIQKINDSHVKSEVVSLTSSSPEYFWEVPASTSGYHHPICRRKYGLWAHTLMAAASLERLLDSRVEMGLISDMEADYARAAILLHDQRKNGSAIVPESKSVSDHDLKMAKVIRYESDLPSEVADAVSTHMGAWYDGPEPSTELERVVHDADMIASTKSITPKVYGSAPEELSHIGVEETR